MLEEEVLIRGGETGSSLMMQFSQKLMVLGDFMNDCRSRRSKENKMLIKLKENVEERDF